MIDDTEFISINLYNANTEDDQLTTFTELTNLLENFGFGFGKTFIDWTKIFLNEQELSVINGGINTKYFNLEKGVRQGKSVSAYLLILCLEIHFMLIKNNKSIKGIKMIKKTFFILLTQMIVLSFLKDKNSIKKLLNTINYFSIFDGLKTKSI